MHSSSYFEIVHMQQSMRHFIKCRSDLCYAICDLSACTAEYLEDQADFLVVPRHQELLGDRAKDCDIPVSIEKTGLEEGRQYALSYVLFRCVCTSEFVP